MSPEGVVTMISASRPPGVVADHAPRGALGAHGFALEAEGAPAIACADVVGFGEALDAARDPRTPAPARLVIVAPDVAMAAWLDTWAEDPDRVRRSVVVRRRVDAAGFSAVATLASHGYGVPTSLAVESISTGEGRGIFLRSGVHPKVDVDAALARFDRFDEGTGQREPG